MKKISLMFLLLIGMSSLAVSVQAITWITANQATVQWDAVTVDENGQSIDPATYRVDYECFLTDPGHANTVGVGRFTEAQAIATLTQEGEFIFGCKAVKVRLSDSADISESQVSWTDNPEMCLNDSPFGLRYFVAPGVPTEYRNVSGG